MTGIKDKYKKDRRLAGEATWKAVVLIPKGGRNFQLIGLVEVLLKAVMVILNFRLGAAINLHDVLHGFQYGSGMGSASLEAKLLKQLTAMREEPLYAIFMYLDKVYSTLDMDRCLMIL